MSLGTLWVVATPIGNLEDITLRGLRILGEVAVIACEDTRTTSKLLARHGIQTPLRSCHEHNEAQRAGELAERLARGEDVALVSDAGTPLLSDPGRRVIAAALELGAAVVPLPGPSAALAALTVSGLAAERFTFYGFPPARGRERERFLDEAMAEPATVILYESPHRVVRTLSELSSRDGARRASYSRELTKLHEETRRGTLTELAAVVAAEVTRGEYTLVIAGAPEPTASGSLEEAVRKARELVAGGSRASAAARAAARSEGVERRDVYRRLVGVDPAGDSST